MRTEASYISNIGRTRKKNEDSLLINDILVSEADMDREAYLQSSDEKQIYVVADGMGGHQMGEFASRSVLEVFRQRYLDIENEADINDVVFSARDALDRLAVDVNLGYGMGTTVSGIFFSRNGIFVFNCGDSRVYILKDGSLKRLTKDHSLVQELVDLGTITESEMRFHPQKNIVTSAVVAGWRAGLPNVDVKTMKISGDSTFLICTDGLWESMGNREMEDCFRDQKKITECLLKGAIAGGGRDNISSIVIRVRDI